MQASPYFTQSIHASIDRAVYLKCWIFWVVAFLKLTSMCMARWLFMSYGLNLGWAGPIGDYIGFWGGPIKGYIKN